MPKAPNCAVPKQHLRHERRRTHLKPIQERIQPALKACRREPQLTVVLFLDEAGHQKSGTMDVT